MKARTSALLLSAAVLVVAGYMAFRAVDLIRVGTVPSVLLGIGVLLLVVVGAALTAGEIRFGLDSERLARRLADEGNLRSLPDDVARMPSGRLVKEAADELFSARRTEVEAAPDDWRTWWHLAAAYGDARDTPRGRKAMRKAISLERAGPPPG